MNIDIFIYLANLCPEKIGFYLVVVCVCARVSDARLIHTLGATIPAFILIYTALTGRTQR